MPNPITITNIYDSKIKPNNVYLDTNLNSNSNSNTNSYLNLNHTESTPLNILSCCITDSLLSNNPFEFESDFEGFDDESIKALFDFADLLINGKLTKLSLKLNSSSLLKSPSKLNTKFNMKVNLKVKDFLGNLLTQTQVRTYISNLIKIGADEKKCEKLINMLDFKISDLCSIFSKNSEDLPVLGSDMATIDKNFENPAIKFYCKQNSDKNSHQFMINRLHKVHGIEMP